MKIGIDGTAFSIPYQCGTKKYAQGLLNGLAKIDSSNEYTIFSLKDIALPGPNFKVSIIPKVPLYSRLMLEVPPQALRGIDVFHKLDPYGILNISHPQVVTTIHDLGTRSTHSRLGKYWYKRLYNDVLFWSTIRHSNSYIADSNITKHELESYLQSYKLPHNQIATVYLGVDIEHATVQNNSQVRDNYILTMGDFSPRKNVLRTIEAFGILKKKYNYTGKLKIIVSSSAFLRPYLKKIDELHLEADIQLLVGIHDDELFDYYQRARLFVFASLYEGFGLPIIEAMSCGCPVVTSNRGAMKEISGSAAMLVDPESVIDISTGMHRMLTDIPSYNIYRNKGYLHAKQFTWENTAKQVLDVYTMKS